MLLPTDLVDVLLISSLLEPDLFDPSPLLELILIIVNAQCPGWNVPDSQWFTIWHPTIPNELHPCPTNGLSIDHESSQGLVKWWSKSTKEGLQLDPLLVAEILFSLVSLNLPTKTSCILSFGIDRSPVIGVELKMTS